MNSRLFELQSASFVTSSINQLTMGNLYGFYVPLFSVPEPQAIAAFLDRKTARIDALVGEAQQVIGLLKERCCTQISEAVTGKIDVRKLAGYTQC